LRQLNFANLCLSEIRKIKLPAKLTCFTVFKYKYVQNLEFVLL
jgi:hypothetical protein